MEKLYINIKNRREELGMSVRELADKVGYKDHSSVVRMEKGLTDISIDRLYKIAKALNTTPIELTGWLEKENGDE